ncbi:MAG: phenylacetate--CoA ligase family protein [Acidimicrobiia bacterium]
MAVDAGRHIWDAEAETQEESERRSTSSSLLRRQLSGLVERSPFYRAKLGEAGVSVESIRDVEDLAALPFTTKDELSRAQLDDPPFGDHLAVPLRDVRRVYQTSGSSGVPTLIAVSSVDIKVWKAIGARAYFAAGIRPASSVLITFGAGPYVAGHTHGMLDMMGCRTVPIAPGDTRGSLHTLELGIVDSYIGTPSFALHLANGCERAGIDGSSLGLRTIVTAGEPGGGLSGIRGRIESVFGARVSEVMGLGDISPSLFGECTAQNGMHFCGQGYVWPELVDQDSGDPVEIEAGAFGELVYTSLVREAMPLVRFRSGDLARITGTTCRCGRTAFKLRCVGRTDDMFIVKGVNVYPSAIASVAAEFHPTLTGRARAVIPEGSGVSVQAPVIVEVETSSGASVPEQMNERVEAAIRAKLRFSAEVRFVTERVFGDPGYKTPPILRSASAGVGNQSDDESSRPLPTSEPTGSATS